MPAPKSPFVPSAAQRTTNNKVKEEPLSQPPQEVRGTDSEEASEIWQSTKQPETLHNRQQIDEKSEGKIIF